jgi:CRP/FNR family transcriptional regulator, anaerobic regulatory protein
MLQTAVVSRSFRSIGVEVRVKPSIRLVPEARTALACASCCLKEVCLPCDLGRSDLDSFGEMATARRRVARGASLYHGGDRFDFIYAVRSGSFKTVGVSRNGDEKITGFHLPGEFLGIEAINSGRHGCSAVALEDSEVCILPFAALEKMAMSTPALQHRLLQLVSGDVSHDQGLMPLLGGMSAEQRLAAFLLSLSRRHQRLGFSASRFVLRMTREELGNYLGLTLETVSRLLSRFQRECLIAVQQRDVELKSAERLMEMAGHW